MKTRTITTYSYDELSPKAKEHAIEEVREITDPSLDCTVEDFKDNIAPEFGFDVSRVFYSGFWSQGDGACFEGTWSPADMRELNYKDEELQRIHAGLKAIASAHPDVSMKIRHCGHYRHEYCTEIDVDTEHLDIEVALTELSRDLMRWLYAALESDYEWQMADEQIVAGMGGMEFTEGGEIY